MVQEFVWQYGEGTRELICIQMNLARSKKESFIFEHLLGLFAMGPHMILAPGKVMRSGTETREGRKTGTVAHGFALGS